MMQSRKTIRARDAQALLRLIYVAETGKPYTEGCLTIAEKHNLQRRYEITRSRDGWIVARPFAEAA